MEDCGELVFERMQAEGAKTELRVWTPKEQETLRLSLTIFSPLSLSTSLSLSHLPPLLWKRIVFNKYFMNGLPQFSSSQHFPKLEEWKKEIHSFSLFFSSTETILPSIWVIEP
jgi:hypothetical protein